MGIGGNLKVHSCVTREDKFKGSFTHDTRERKNVFNRPESCACALSIASDAVPHTYTCMTLLTIPLPMSISSDIGLYIIKKIKKIKK